MKKKRQKKKFLTVKQLLLFVGLLIIIVSFSSGLYKTYAALTDKDQKQNEFRIGDFQTSIEEEFDPPANFEPDKEYLKKVSIRNTGEQESFIRVLALPVLTKKQVNGTTQLLVATVEGPTAVLTIDYNLTDWFDGKDGYFYYKKKLIKGESTTNLFTKVMMNKGNITEEYEGVFLSIEIKAEGISSTKFAYRDAWWGGKTPIENPLLAIDESLKNQTISE
ncbi:hypothetical protein BCR23_12340 [Enterococcus quebecensis]|uniref:Alternate signal-mediated exported protein n=1 Tax=Enterococcus quebecensis TaxID=903983 RepID=A0A1E5GPT2_9ENTE|nr:hypothetical protein BCR23_12340 [Enterococcus quebecensis]